MDDENEKREISRFIKKVASIITKVVGMVINVIMSLSTTTLIVIAILIVISSIVYIVTTKDGSRDDDDDDNNENVGYVVYKEITSEVTPQNIVKKDSGGYGFNIDLDEKVKKVKEDLKEEKLLDEYISQENQDEYLKNFIKADIKTRYQT